MKLIEITKDNWEKVILLTTNKDNLHTVDEEYVASNAYSMVESFFESHMIVKAIEHDCELIGFAMFGIPGDGHSYELRRFMIDRKFQGQGYGKQALFLIVEYMRNRFGCKEIYLSTDPDNTKGKHVYESLGFVSTREIQDEEEVYVLKL
ncbi:diamine N-acetyltransferase [Paenibacillus shirakamiensis]|uniref:Diamine N-acetyltransferase n=1 Tax=Paenibacillus shirakamiensis TaxID=1265935 RepID=A0ABS4JEK3_9BACL|nr:GNAT family N-acetyltransferase [Paenibacillus shirakamiensis]MBP2000115.1 diamine N-acetyltransferase [Paenibacillus shirakamiensis]